MSLLVKSASLLFVGGGSCIWAFLNMTSSNSTHPSNLSTQSSSDLSTQNTENTTPAQTIQSDSQDDGQTEKEEDVLSPDEPENKDLPNCLLRKGPDEVISKLPTISSPYLSFSCDNSGRGDTLIMASWTIWIPTKLLNEKHWLEGEQRIDIKTHTTPVEDDDNLDLFKTRFESESFVNTVMTGTWGWNILEDSLGSEEHIYSVKITEPNLEDNPI